MNKKIQALRGELIVSCQALPEEPLHSSYIMSKMAAAALREVRRGFVLTRRGISERFRKRWIFRSLEL